MAIGIRLGTASGSAILRRTRRRLRRWSRRHAATLASAGRNGLAGRAARRPAGASGLPGLGAIKPLLRRISHLDTALAVVIADGRRRSSAERDRSPSEALSERDRLMARLDRLERDNARLAGLLSAPKGARVCLRNASAHDLKTPLCTLESILDTLVGVLDDDGDRRQAKSLARLAELSSSRMRALVDDILEQGRRRDATDEPAELVDLAELVSAAVDRQRPSIEERRISIRVAGSLPVVSAPRRAMTAVVNNLIENAVKYMGCGRIREIHVGSEVENGRRTIWVEDTGCGFDPARIEDAFRPYVRCNEEVEGTGLGLAIVKKAVEGWGGTVKIDTLPGRGTTVRFSTPDGSSKTDVRQPAQAPPLAEDRP